MRLVLSSRKNEFVKKYDYGRGMVDLGEWVIRHSYGCRANCFYCYINNGEKNLIVFNNYEKLLKEIEILMEENKENFLYFNAGENSDSLFLDEETFLSKILVPFFAKQKNVYLELRTKSNKIDNLLKLAHQGKTIVAFSLNPEEIIKEYEVETANLYQRINAAKECSKAGYPIGIRLDPILYIDNWEVLYTELLDKIFENIEPKFINSISLGTLRTTNKMLKEGRNGLFLTEFVPCKDGKYRYFKPIRIKIYKKLVSLIKKYDQNLPIYLSSEPDFIWKNCLNFVPKSLIQILQGGEKC